MALVSSNFAERYAELTSRVPTLTERLLDVQRREACARREVEAQADAAFQDVLHVRAIMIADKRARQEGSTALIYQHALTLYKQETAVWFPAAPPRTVPFRANRPLRAFPHAAFREMCDEERELRQWLYGVERRLRQHIEEACSRSWFYLNIIDDTIAKENHERQRMQKDEDAAFTELKQRFFRTVPADYFRSAVIARYGSSAPTAAELLQDVTMEAMEEKARASLCAEEVQARKAVFQYLQTAYDVRLFALNHREVIERYELEQAETNELYPLIAFQCRADFGGSFYHIPALALHLSSACPSLRALCLAELQRAPQQAAAVAPAATAPAHTTTTTTTIATVATTGSSPLPPPLDVDNAFAEELDEPREDPEELEEETEKEMHNAEPHDSQETTSADVPPTIDDTRAAFPTALLPLTASEVCAATEVVGASVDDFEPTAEQRRKEWEVNHAPLAAVQTTLYAYEKTLPVLRASEEKRAVPVLPQPVVEPWTNVAAEEARPEQAVTLSHNDSELTCSPQPLPKSVFTTEEIFIGDPFAETPKKDKKAKKAKKHKKSSKSKKTK